MTSQGMIPFPLPSKRRLVTQWLGDKTYDVHSKSGIMDGGDSSKVGYDSS